MPGDKWRDHTPDIGRAGRLVLLALVVILALGSLGWLLVSPPIPL